MAGYSGSFLKGLAGGIQTGFGMGQQIQQMKWQKEQKKKLEKDEELLQESWTSFKLANPNIFASLEAGTTLTPDQEGKLWASSFGMMTEMKEHIKARTEAIKSGDRRKTEEEEKWMKDWANYLAEYGSLSENELDDYIFQDFITSESGKRYITAHNEKAKQKEEATRVQTEKAEAPGIKDHNDAWNHLMNWKDVSPEAFERKKSGFQNQFPAIDMTDITQEALRSGVTEEIEPEPTPIAFKTLQNVKDSFKNVKTREEYDSALQSYNTSKEAKASDWTPPPFENQLMDLIKKVENAIWADYVNKDTGKLKDKNLSEEYNVGLQHYLRLIEEAKNAGMDVSQFQAFIPYEKLYQGLGNPLVTKESW